METEATKMFKRKTEAGLVACGRWLEDNAADLAGTFGGGCRSWSVSFESGDEGMFPEIRIFVDKIDRGIIDAYVSASS